ncbi:MAG: AAA family ATPase [Actinobacteria bacterium]|nr:AAA family ATPase [Actinomycetota bacterium]
MDLQIKKAVRELVFTKTALMGASGSGKTYSSLRLAKGMEEELEKVLGRPAKTLMANTEKSRGLYYANEFNYDIINVDAPHEPEKYAELIYKAVELGYDILIMDSTSHEWDGAGGCLALQQLAGGTYQAWAKITPRHDKFLLAIAESPIHIIATMRGKDQYEIEKSDTGKITVTKLGVGAIQRAGFEFEFTETFLLDQKDNFAVAQKDNTHLFEKEGRILLSEKNGQDIIKWANSGSGYTPKVYMDSQKPENVLAAIKKDIIEKIKSKGGSKNPELKTLFEKEEITLDTKGVNAINDVGFATEFLKKLDEVKEIE